MRFEDIRTDQEYCDTVAYFQALIHSPADQDHIEEINVLGGLIETYEILHGLTPDE